MNARLASAKKYIEIIKHYESCLAKHGDSHLGVDWPKAQDAETRYRVMLEVIPRPRAGTSRLLDFGCGASHLYEYMIANDIQGIEYTGLDLSPKFVELSRKKFPKNNYVCADILEEPETVPAADYIVMNGVFTEKRGLDFDEMLDYFERTVKAAFARAERGLAFNVMSKHVDWEREDLFHLPFDTLARFLVRELTRNFVIRNDYGLYEYTAYVYR
ncbi:MAG TPA: class I SAM-dependent methyltransferase [Candidatus Sulfotelmatobacter sp.]|nr:class I SAM-dependent methyltransferase [Candidatus Sulfotelmatobacter sp.]